MRRPPPWTTLHLCNHRLENQAITRPWDGVNFNFRNTEPVGNLHQTVTPFNDLFDCLSLEFGCVVDSLHDFLSSSISTLSGVY